MFGFGDKRTLEELRAERQRLEEELLKPGEDWEKFSRFKGKVVRTEVVTCYELEAEEQAVLLIFEDGTIKVRCKGGCYHCKYGQCLPNRY